MRFEQRRIILEGTEGFWFAIVIGLTITLIIDRFHLITPMYS